MFPVLWEAGLTACSWERLLHGRQGGGNLWAQETPAAAIWWFSPIKGLLHDKQGMQKLVGYTLVPKDAGAAACSP